MLSCATAEGDLGLTRGMQGVWEPGPRLRCKEESSRAGAQALGRTISLRAANRSPQVRLAETAGSEALHGVYCS